MMAQMTDYIKNIAMYLIFMAFIGIILPDNKHKNYIDVVLGLVLVLIVLGPVLPMLSGNGPVYKPLADESVQAFAEDEYYDGLRRELIRKNFVTALNSQVNELLKDTGREVAGIQVNYDEDTGAIYDLNVELMDGPRVPEKKLIRIETGESPDVTRQIDPIEIKNLKKIISDFYKLSVDNIHITVQKEKGEGYE